MEDKRKCLYCGKELEDNEQSIICYECDRDAWTDHNGSSQQTEEL